MKRRLITLMIITVLISAAACADKKDNESIPVASLSKSDMSALYGTKWLYSFNNASYVLSISNDGDMEANCSFGGGSVRTINGFLDGDRLIIKSVDGTKKTDNARIEYIGEKSLVLSGYSYLDGTYILDNGTPSDDIKNSANGNDPADIVIEKNTDLSPSSAPSKDYNEDATLQVDDFINLFNSFINRLPSVGDEMTDLEKLTSEYKNMGLSVSVSGYRENMDGKIGTIDNGCCISLGYTINDYNTAEQIYDLLCDWAKKNKNEEMITERIGEKIGTSWYSSWEGEIRSSDYGFYNVRSELQLTKSRYDDGYGLSFIFYPAAFKKAFSNFFDQ